VKMFWSQDRKWVESEATAVRPGAPQGLAPDGEGGVRDLDRDLVGGLAGQVAAPGVAQLFLAVGVPAAGGHRADAGVGAIGVDGQHQPLGQHLNRQGAAAGDGADLVQAPGA